MVAWLVATAVMFQSAVPAQPVTVTLAGVAPELVTCALSNPADDTAPSRFTRSGATIEWACREGDRLECDALQHEPIDLDAGSCKRRAIALPFRRAAPVALTTRAPATVEWRAEASTGTRVIAAREITVGVRPLVFEQGRLLRVYRGHFSPVTLYVVPGQQADAGLPMAGGELFGRIAKKRVNPERIRLDGSAAIDLPLDGAGRFARAGLTSGEYRVIPMYAGGVEGAPQVVRIRDGESTELYGLASEDVGGIVLSVANEICTPENGLLLTRYETSLRSVKLKTAVRQQLAEGCEWRFEGLVPGRYEALIRGAASDVRAAHDFQIVADQLEWAHITEPAVIIEGRVRLGDRPAAGVTLQFQKTDRSSRSWVATTGADGTYHAATDRPGFYVLELRAARYLGSHGRRVALQPGTNRIDLDLPASRLAVRLERADGRSFDEPVQVHLRGETIPPRSGFVLPTEEHEIEFLGLPNGTYVVTADSPSGLIAERPGQVMLSEGAPDASVALRLALRQGELRLVWDDGSPVQAARVQSNMRVLDEEAPGQYALRSAAPGSELLISAPGAVPVCHVLAPAEIDSATIVMTRGQHAAELRFTPRIPFPIGVFDGLPGSNCPVPITLMSLQAEETTESTIVRVLGLPAGRFSFRPTRVTPAEIVDVPGSPVTFTKPAPRAPR